jgi:spermidine/putrescine ABC transporter ATP-binding subunit
MTSISKFISIEGVSKTFGSIVAVDNVNIEISTGEFFSLLGPSGCGKTTLLRMLAGFESPSSGEIYIDGKAMSEIPPHQRPTNMVFQNYAIFPHLDVASNIAYGLRKDKLGKVEQKRMVEEALEMVKLPGYGKRRSNELSGGQLQRVALARALIKRPKVLLLDEPLGALDKKLREEMQLELRVLQESVGITFIFVTHDQEEALTLSDRVAVMARGNVLQMDSPQQLYNHPVNVEVADFIGRMNFFDARVNSLHGDVAHLDTGGLGQLKLSVEVNRLQQDDQVILALRPEKVYLTNERTEDEHTVKGKLSTSAYFGDRSHYYVSVEGIDKLIEVSGHDSKLTGGHNFERGSEVWLSWNENSLVVLPANQHFFQLHSVDV